LPGSVGSAGAAEVSEFAVLIAEVANVAVAFGSSVRAADDELELGGCAVLVGSSPSSSPSSSSFPALDVAAGVDVVSVVDVVVTGVRVLASRVLVLLVLPLAIDVTATFGHKLTIPSPFWKTPIMLSSPASTSAQLFFTSSPIFTRPRTHSAVHVAPALKSSAWQPDMAAL
jgi:hypothetical protein